jgi:hypothetical protein
MGLNRITKRIVTCLGIAVMLDIPAVGLEPGRVEEAEGPGLEPPIEEEQEEPKLVGPGALPETLWPEYPHGYEEDLRPVNERQEALAPIGPAPTREQRFTLRLKPSVTIPSPTTPTGLTIKEIGQPIPPLTMNARQLFGEETDLTRLQEKLESVLERPHEQVRTIIEQLRHWHEITVGNEVADNPYVLEEHAPGKDAPFTLHLLADNTSGPFLASTTKKEPRLVEDTIAYESSVPPAHAELYAHFTESQLRAFGMTPDSGDYLLFSPALNFTPKF